MVVLVLVGFCFLFQNFLTFIPIKLLLKLNKKKHNNNIKCTTNWPDNESNVTCVSCKKLIGIDMIGLRVNNALDNACRLCEKLTILWYKNLIYYTTKKKHREIWIHFFFMLARIRKIKETFTKTNENYKKEMNLPLVCLNFDFFLL